MKAKCSTINKVISGFTLIELLVVIAIIAILAAVLFPVFAQVREKARQTTCLSNKRQVVMGLLQYVQDYDEEIPFDSYGGGYRDNTTFYDWQDMVYPYVKSEAAFDCPDNPYTSNNVDASGNLITDFTKSNYIYYKNLKTGCNTNYGSDSITLGYFTGYESYGTPPGPLTTHAPCNDQPANPSNWGCIDTVGGIEAPATTAWFTDGIYLENPQYCALCVTPTVYGQYETLGFVFAFHHNMCTVAYCDGHAASVSMTAVTRLSNTGNDTYAIFTTEDD